MGLHRLPFAMFIICAGAAPSREQEESMYVAAAIS